MKKRLPLFQMRAVLIGSCLVLLLGACGSSTGSAPATSPTPTSTPSPTVSPTPSPDIAPANDTSFKINVTFQSSQPYEGEPFASNPVLIITGHTDGGTVCSPHDNGQPFTFSGTFKGSSGQTVSFTETDTASCSGTYMSGKVNYVETDTASASVRDNGTTYTCTLNNPTVVLRLTGTYADNNTFNGTINYPEVPYSCNPAYQYFQAALDDTWTGTIVQSS